MDNEDIKMPKELTAENGAKYSFMGEFEESVRLACASCFHEIDEDCDFCNGSGYYIQKVPISWANIKAIYQKAVKEHGEPI